MIRTDDSPSINICPIIKSIEETKIYWFSGSLFSSFAQVLQSFINTEFLSTSLAMAYL
ncbi:hypothetical protein ABIB50_003904 [Mucilaginibacter sp. UYCu711]